MTDVTMWAEKGKEKISKAQGKIRRKNLIKAFEDMRKNPIGAKNVMYVPEQESPRQLPIYKIRGKFYFRDVRLGEYRNTRNFMDRIPINDVSLSDLQTPTKADRLRKVI